MILTEAETEAQRRGDGLRAGNSGGLGVPRGLEHGFALSCHSALCSVMQRLGRGAGGGGAGVHPICPSCWRPEPRGAIRNPSSVLLCSSQRQPSQLSMQKCGLWAVAFLALLSARAFPHTDISIHSGEHRGQGQGQVGGSHFQGLEGPLERPAAWTVGMLRGSAGGLR